MGRSSCSSKEGLNKGAWSSTEDKILTDYIRAHGEGRWGKVPKRAGLNRCGRSCRLRWLNYLRPDIKRGNISDDEEDLIIRLHKLLGNRWSLIAGRLPGRTDNEIKNYWNTVLKKKVQEARPVPSTNQACLNQVEERRSKSKTSVQVEAHEVIQGLAPDGSPLAPQDCDLLNLLTSFDTEGLSRSCHLDLEFFQLLGENIQQDMRGCSNGKLSVSFDEDVFFNRGTFENWVGTDHILPYASLDLGSLASFFGSES